MIKKKVVFCTDGVSPHAVGGMQRHSRLLVEELAKCPEIDLTVIHPHVARIFEQYPVHEISVEGIDIRKNYLLECYRYSKRVYAKILLTDPDVVYSQGLSVWYGARHLKEKLIINPHGLEPYQVTGFKFWLSSLPFRVIFSYLFRQARVVISLGGNLTAILKKHCPISTNIVQIPNAANISLSESPRKLPTDRVKALFVARFAENKGINILFDAVAELNKTESGRLFEFTLVGKGPLYDFYYKRNVCENVVLKGFVSDDQLPALYRSHDVFVFPTLFEGMPTVVLEAMSYGLPVIVSNVGATSELVGNDNGKLIRAGSKDELVSALNWFASLPSEEKSRLSQSSFNKFKSRFTWTAVGKQYAALLTSFYANDFDQEN